MNLDPNLQAQIIAFLLLMLPLVAVIWKIFAWLDQMQSTLEHKILEVDRRLTDLDHRSTLRSTQIEALNDKVALAVNGTKELVNHLRARTKTDHEQLQHRLDSVERFLNKTTDFQPRD